MAHGHHGAHVDGEDPFGLYVGITMAMLGVMLAVSAAKVGGERTELVKSLVEQQHAHAKYQAQDIKHRVAILSVRQLHSMVPELRPADGASSPLDAAARQAGPNKADALAMADTAERYFGESQLAKEWVDSFDAAIQAHVIAQEHFEEGQLLAEIGIVIASIALMLKHRLPWYLSIALGLACIFVVGRTWIHTREAVHATEARIAETGKAYRDQRSRNKMTAADEAVTQELRVWGGGPATAPAKPTQAPAGPGPGAAGHGH